MEPREWHPRMLPPIWLVVGIAAQAGLDRWLPLAELVDGRWQLAGIAFVLAGIALALWGERQFAAAGTGAIPGSEITAFVRTGPYRRIRNPMYVGMTLVLVGSAVLFGAATCFLVPVAFVLIIDRGFVRREEAMLRARFGEDAWNDYARTTRRWL